MSKRVGELGLFFRHSDFVIRHFPPKGSWSNRKTSVLQTEDSGAIPDESIQEAKG